MFCYIASLISSLVFGAANPTHAQACADDKSAKSALETCALPQNAQSKAISGRCELSISNSAPVSCARIQLLLRAKSEKKSQDHAAAIDGFNFKFTDLGQTPYDMILASPEFELNSKSQLKGLKPGQSDLKIRIDAKPLK